MLLPQRGKPAKHNYPSTQCDNPQIILITLPCNVFFMYSLMDEVPESQSYFVLAKRELEKKANSSLMAFEDLFR